MKRVTVKMHREDAPALAQFLGMTTTTQGDVCAVVILDREADDYVNVRLVHPSMVVGLHRVRDDDRAELGPLWAKP